MQLTVERDVVEARTETFAQSGSFVSRVVNTAFDRLWAKIQEKTVTNSNLVQRPSTSTSTASLDLPDPSSNELLGWNSGADALENKIAADIDLATVTTFINTLLDDADASEALDTLGLSAFAKTLIDDADASAALTTLGVSTFAQTILDDADADAVRTTLSIQNNSKNYITNPSFRVAQRGTSFISSTTPDNGDDTYLLDRWILLSDGDDIVDVTRGTDGAVGNGTYLQADVETVSKKFGFLQILENLDVQDILSESDVVSLSFNALVSDATKLSRIKAMILSSTQTESTMTSDFVNVWGIEGTSPTQIGGWVKEGDSGDSGDLGVTASDARYTLENVAIDTSNVVNIAVFIWSDDVATNDTLGTLLKITNVKLEKGAVATPFQAIPIQQEVALCQRYFQKSFNQSQAPAQNSGTQVGALSYRVQVAGTAGDGSVHAAFPVLMRATPNITFYNPDAANAKWRNDFDGGDSGTASASSVGQSGFMAGNNQAAGDGIQELIVIHYQAESEL